MFINSQKQNESSKQNYQDSEIGMIKQESQAGISLSSAAAGHYQTLLNISK